MHWSFFVVECSLVFVFSLRQICLCVLIHTLLSVLYTRTNTHAVQPHEHGEVYLLSVVAEQCSCEIEKCGGQKTKIILTHGGRERQVQDGGRQVDLALKDAGPKAPEGGKTEFGPIQWNSVSASTRKKPKNKEWKVGQRPREKTAAVRAREEGARSRRAMPSSFAKSTKTNEQKKVRFVVPQEVPNTDVDKPDVDDSEWGELQRALKSALETRVLVCADEWLSVFTDYVGRLGKRTRGRAQRAWTAHV